MNHSEKMEDEIKHFNMYLVKSIHAEDSSDLIEDKINILAYIASNRDKILCSNLFFDEDCLFSILNWLWQQKDNFSNDNFYFFKLNDLFFNALLVFETFPLNIDFFSVKLFLNKFLKIGNLLKNVHFGFYQRFTQLYNYWLLNYNLKQPPLLNKKRQRSNDTEFESSDETYVSAYSYKKVNWKINLVDIIYINTNQPPINQ